MKYIIIFLSLTNYLINYGFCQVMEDYPIKPVNFSKITISDKFWSPRIETNRTITIPFAFQKCEETGRIKNFELAGKVNKKEIKESKFLTKYGFDDSDVFKIIEGAAYSLSNKYDKDLDKYLDALIDKIEKSQESDGYLYTMRTIDPKKSWAKERWINDRIRESHELYNVGHLYEAAVAYFYATGKKSLLNIAIKNANLLLNTFGKNKINTVPGHQVIEIGLTKLYRVTGEKKYLDLAKYFLDERGKGNEKNDFYNQDHIPVIEQKEAVGHAVRACYMYAGIADVGAILQNKGYIEAINSIWEDVVSTKLYITGGVGAAGDWEGFGPKYELPNLTAYNETCASIAMVYWNYRMFLLTGESKYIDILERTLYNGLISGVSLDGKEFFYPNPLESDGNYKRSEWFECACCPGNITRFISSVSGYIYATKNDNLFVNLFIGGKGNIEIKNTKIEIEQSTDYPWKGNSKLIVKPSKPTKFSILIRIPGWLQGKPVPSNLYSYLDNEIIRPEIAVNGSNVEYKIINGYASIERIWKKDDKIQLNFPMKIQKVIANEKVKDDKNKICLERGPIVYCAEGIDNDSEVNDFIIPQNSEFKAFDRDDLLNGLVVLKGDGFKLKLENGKYNKQKYPVTLIPYYAWCHRDNGKMTVWFNDENKVFPPKMNPKSTLFIDSLKVEFDQYSDQVIRYTLNDELPNSNSNLYTTPIILKNERNNLKAVSFNAKAHQSELVEEKYNKTEFNNAVELKNPKLGVNYKYFEGKIENLKNFPEINPKKAGLVENFDILSMRNVEDHYQIIFDTYISIENDDVYTFYMSSDDGSILYIDDHEVINNDGIHGVIEKSGQIALRKGFHKIKLFYFEYNYGEKLKLFFSNNIINKTIIPNNILFFENK